MAEMTANLAFWIDFEEARRALETLVDLAHDEPDELPVCVILVGQSGMWKTAILREAQRRIAMDFPEPYDGQEARYAPVLRTVIPSSPTSLKINLILLWKQGWPITHSMHRVADLKAVELLRKQRTRLVAVDNVHAIPTAGGKARRDTLDAFRFLMSEGNVPMVVSWQVWMSRPIFFLKTPNSPTARSCCGYGHGPLERPPSGGFSGLRAACGLSNRSVSLSPIWPSSSGG